MSFRDRSWDERFAAMGDEAEGVFEQVYPNGYVRTGLNRPPIQMGRLSRFSRYTPDYLTSGGYVEVQGFGADGVVKTKHEKLAALHEWAKYEPVRLFLWDSTNKRYTLVDLDEFHTLVLRHATEKSFPEGKGYWALAAEHLEGWKEHAPQT